MLTFLIVQEREDSLHILFSKLIQISITNPDNNVICSCNSEMFDLLKRCCPKNINLIHYEISVNFMNIKISILNWINSIEFAVKNYGHGLFISEQTILVNKIPLTEELKLQKVAFLKLLDCENGGFDEEDSNVVVENKNNNRFSSSIFYISQQSAIDSIKELFSEKTDLFKEEEEEVAKDIEEKEDEDEETKIKRKRKIIQEKINIHKQYVSVFANIPYSFTDIIENDELTDEQKYITHKGFLTTSDFFRLENSHKKENILVKDGAIMNNNDKVWGIIIETSRAEHPIQIVNAHLTKSLVSFNITYLPALNMIWQKDILNITIPKKDGLYHWNRNNDLFYNYVENISNNNQFISLNQKETHRSHFYISNYVLFDKSDVKYLTNELNGNFGILYMDYSNELLEAFNSNDNNTVFLGYYCPYLTSLEGFVNQEDVNRMGTKTLKEGDYNSEQEFESYIDDLATFKYFTVDKNTPKNRIAECLRLGVVPRLVDDTKLLELEEIAKDKDTDWEILSEKCKKYYSENVSLEAITNKLLKIIFNM